MPPTGSPGVLELDGRDPLLRDRGGSGLVATRRSSRIRALTKTIHGREYDIYVDGDRVKMIAWHRGEKSYWVSNDLLETLTNDQMVGIARSADVIIPKKSKAEGEEVLSEQREPVGVIGVGWVGLVTAACFAELGHPVIARDILQEKVDSLARGEVTIHEPGLADLVRRNAERLTFTTDMGELLDAARLLFVCVDTPPTYSGDADLSRVRAVVDELPEGSDHVLIMKSTVPAGTGEAIRRDLPGLAYVSCPEFLKEGTAVADFMHPDRVVIGADPGDEEAAAAVAALYEPLGEILHTDVSSAEMIKLASNAFLATKISFINEIANVCEEVGADVGEVARGMGLDERIGSSFLRAGIGYGGSCFPKDVTALKMLAGNTGYHFQLLNAVIEVNELQKRRVVGKLEKHLGSLLGKRVALLGLAFKPDTDDMREASSLVLAARLQGEGAEVVAYDPVASERAGQLLDSVELAGSALEALEGADAAVLVTEWSEFAELDWAEVARRMAQPLIVDGRNFLDPVALGAAGFEYEGIGKAQRRVAPEDAAASGVGAGNRPSRRRGDAAAAADQRRPEAGPDPGRPPLPRLHDRVAGGARGDRGGARLWLPARRSAGGAGRGRARRGAAHLRDRARPPRHRRGDPLRRRRARRRPRRPLPRPQRRRPHRSRPDRPDARPRASARRGRRSPSTRSRTPPPTAWSASTATAP